MELAGSSLKDFTKDYFNGIGIYKKNKQAVLKLGGEMEYYYPTMFWGHNITDSLQPVRRVQALDSSKKKSDIKYVSRYCKIKKKNRVYIKGKLIDETWSDLDKIYALNDDNGHWFKTDETTFSKTFVNDNGDETLRYDFSGYDSRMVDNKDREEFEFVTGRYLMDELLEWDRVEYTKKSYNIIYRKIDPQKTAGLFYSSTSLSVSLSFSVMSVILPISTSYLYE